MIWARQPIFPVELRPDLAQGARFRRAGLISGNSTLIRERYHRNLIPFSVIALFIAFGNSVISGICD